MGSVARSGSHWVVALAVGGTALGASVNADAEPLVYAVVNPSTLGTFDLGTGTFTEIGELPEVGTLREFGDLARLPGGKLYSHLTDQRLVIVDTDTATPEVVGSTGDHRIFALSFRHDGVLFGLSLTDLYTIDLETAAATHVGAHEVQFGPYYDIAFNADDELFMTRGNGAETELYRLDAETAAATRLGSCEFNVMATDFVDNTLYGFTTRNQLITLDPEDGSATLVTSYPEFVFGVATFAETATAGAGGSGGNPAHGGDGGIGGVPTGGSDGGSASERADSPGGAAGSAPTSAGGVPETTGGANSVAGSGGAAAMPVGGQGGSSGGGTSAAVAAAGVTSSASGGRATGGIADAGSSAAGTENAANVSGTSGTGDGNGDSNAGGCIAARSNASSRDALWLLGGALLALSARRRRGRRKPRQ